MSELNYRRDRREEIKETPEDILRRQNEKKDVIEVMSTRQGRNWTWRILSDCGLHSTTYTGNSLGNFLEGKRAIGLRIFNEVMSYCPHSFWVMQMENLPDYNWEEFKKMLKETQNA